MYRNNRNSAQGCTDIKDTTNQVDAIVKRSNWTYCPQDAFYGHNERWGDGNGFSHVRSALLGPSISVPFKEKSMLLGTWQQIIFIDFANRPRNRKIIVQLVGD